MRDYSTLNDLDLLAIFNGFMKFEPTDVDKSVKDLTKSYPNAFWTIYREVEHRGIYKKPDHLLFVGIVGSRRRDTEEDLYLIVNEFNKIDHSKTKIVVVSGLCPEGGDRFATIIYYKHKTMKLWFPAEWSLGRHAGFVRNTEIARWSDYLIATPSSDRKGGTEDTIRKFTRFHGHDNLVVT